MDFFVGAKMYNHWKKSKESFEENTSAEPSGTASTVTGFVSLGISILIGIFSVYLSWSCNTASGMGTGLKIVFAIFAFIFGVLYLIFYLIFRAGRCSPNVIVVQSPAAMTPPPAAPAVPTQPSPPVTPPAAAPVTQGGRKGKGRKMKKW